MQEGWSWGFLTRLSWWTHDGASSHHMWVQYMCCRRNLTWCLDHVSLRGSHECWRSCACRQQQHLCRVHINDLMMHAWISRRHPCFFWTILFLAMICNWVIRVWGLGILLKISSLQLICSNSGKTGSWKIGYYLHNAFCCRRSCTLRPVCASHLALGNFCNGRLCNLSVLLQQQVLRSLEIIIANWYRVPNCCCCCWWWIQTGWDPRS